MYPATRRPHGSGEETVRLTLRVHRDARDLLDELSAALGIGKGLIVERLVQSVELDEHGRPVGWPETRQGEVPVER